MWVTYCSETDSKNCVTGKYSSQPHNLNPLRFFYQNIRSLRTKLPIFSTQIVHFDCDVIIITESWLNDNILDVKLGLRNFDIYRYDRAPNLDRGLRGDGVVIAVNKNFSNYCCTNPDDSVEQLWVKVNSNNLDYLICAVYFPPGSDPLQYDHFGNSLIHFSSAYSNYQLIICGDFNLPNIDWLNSDLSANFTIEMTLHLRLPPLPVS